MTCDHSHHRIDDEVGSDLQLFQLLRRFAGAQAFEHKQCVDYFTVGKGLAQHVVGIDRQEGQFGTDTGGFRHELAHVVDRLFHDVDRTRRLCAHLRHPEWRVLVLEPLHAMAEEAGLLRRAFEVDENRQVAGQSHRVHGFEEEGAVTAHEVLDIVLGGRQQHVDAGLVHPMVKPAGIKRRYRFRTLGGVEHD